jgi:hypothetical protein
VNIGAPFPPDLPDLLRLACGQGKLRLNVWFGAEKGHQANLANSGQGWTVEYDRDCLEAITRVLRVRYGPMLERMRAGASERAASDAVHIAHKESDYVDRCEDTADDDLLGLIG